jgi:hypothetical protein
MKKSFVGIAILIAIALLPGCKKVCDILEDNPEADIKQCPILQFRYNEGFSPDTINFTYNAWGDPVKGIRRLPKTGAPNYSFKYDWRKRLTDYIGLYVPGNGAEFWHKYYYDAMDRVVLDTNFIFTQIVGGQPVGYLYFSVTYYTYDSHRRIIKDSTVFSVTPPYSSGGLILNNYSYGADGNKVGPTYDSKINYHRTNKVWMFLDREYSLNNPFTAVSYNSTGLPTKVSLPSHGPFQRFLTSSFTEGEFTYGCK